MALAQHNWPRGEQTARAAADRGSGDRIGVPGLSRRRLLHTAGLGAVGLFWTDWLRAAAVDKASAASPARRKPARNVILIFNAGAPSHIDLWDPKPHAPDGVRGPFKPIDTIVPGIQVSELLPNLARHTDKMALVRSVHHSHGAHNAGMYWSIVGRPYPRDDTLINPSRTDFPSLGTLAGWLAHREGYAGSLPPYVITPAPHCDSTQYITPGQYGGFLGVRYDPFVLNADPNADGFQVANLGLVEGVSTERFVERRRLLAGLDARTVHAAAALDQQANQERALELVTSDVRGAFDLAREPAAVRERYGRHSWGQSHLLARRLIEAGVPFVTTVNGPSIVWDTHSNNFNQLQQGLVPPMERAFAALLEDLADRGLLETTLVVWMGDFGRTPIINGNAGRDHWPQCYTMLLAGGGIRGGQVVGRSDSTGAVPAERPVTPADVHATVFAALGYNPHAVTYHTPDGRPIPLSEGEPIREIL